MCIMDMFKAGIVVVNAFGVEFVILEKRNNIVYMQAMSDETRNIVEVPISAMVISMGIYKVLPEPYSYEVYMKIGHILKWYLESKNESISEIVNTNHSSKGKLNTVRETALTIPGTIVQHFKGKYYIVLDTITVSNKSLTQMVVYQALYDDSRIWTRDFDEFVSRVDTDKYPNAESEYRFISVDLFNTPKDIQLRYFGVLEKHAKKYYKIESEGLNSVINLSKRESIIADVQGTDCGTRKGIKVRFTKERLYDFRYQNIQKDDGTLVNINQDTYKEFLGKDVVIRSPMYCMGIKYCSACAGKRFDFLDSHVNDPSLAKILISLDEELDLRTIKKIENPDCLKNHKFPKTPDPTIVKDGFFGL